MHMRTVPSTEQVAASGANERPGGAAKRTGAKKEKGENWSMLCVEQGEVSLPAMSV